MRKALRIFFLLLLFSAGALSLSRISCSAQEIEVEIGGDYDGDYENADVGMGAFNSDSEEQLKSGFNGFLKRYGKFIIIAFGVATLTLFVIFLFSLLAFGSKPDNPRTRQNSSTQLLFCAIATAVLGSFTVVFSLIFNALR